MIEKTLKALTSGVEVNRNTVNHIVNNKIYRDYFHTIKSLFKYDSIPIKELFSIIDTSRENTQNKLNNGLLKISEMYKSNNNNDNGNIIVEGDEQASEDSNTNLNIENE